MPVGEPALSSDRAELKGRVMDKKHNMQRDDQAAKSPVTHRASKSEETEPVRPEKSTSHQSSEHRGVSQGTRKDHR
jgi:hypothetical protein